MNREFPRPLSASARQKVNSVKAPMVGCTVQSAGRSGGMFTFCTSMVLPMRTRSRLCSRSGSSPGVSVKRMLQPVLDSSGRQATGAGAARAPQGDYACVIARSVELCARLSSRCAPGFAMRRRDARHCAPLELAGYGEPFAIRSRRLDRHAGRLRARDESRPSTPAPSPVGNR